MSITRRGFLTASGLVLGSWSLAACGDDSGDGKSADGKTKLSVFSWWTGGGEEAGLKAMVADFEKRNSKIKFSNDAIAGGAGSKAKAVLASRLSSHNPPDSFQGHAGAELSDYIKAGQIEDLTFLYEQEGWRKVFPETLLPLLTLDGKIYSVPVNIHRANVLWHNVKVLEEAGVSEPPKTLDDFHSALDKVKGKGKIALVVGEQWTQQHLLETVLLGKLGADGYAALWKKGGDWGGTQVKDALETWAELLKYTNTDAASLTWQDASKLLGDGKAGFNVMGDWADSYFTVDLKLKPKTDYGWSAAPGTDGLYQFLSDSFTLPKGAKHREQAIAWLKECGSKAGQDAFNPKKGSIPARNDADPALYGTYLQWALEEWKKDKVVGSLTHGVVANLAWTSEIGTALGLFLGSKNVGKLQDALAKAAGKYAV
ncbi:ABC transporter substrate-binding protein [Wenjunlia tyrosinilytica]|uniref:Probable sugar-binding periplasmic protein n=1 Tax=Wenjunlia tyrosinilytica TaxID=1544741 RepID=A0A917ZZC5_9ACTN|nr:ABC transporter substrate-binding protein [Wenjunlia tyrosinilytica]GGO99965.1 ABC transporter substrate-binding protein [Wenjunlia tyrosinilytica]